MKTVGISPKAVLAFLLPAIGTLVLAVLDQVLTPNMDPSLKIAIVGLANAILAFAGAYAGSPGAVTEKTPPVLIPSVQTYSGTTPPAGTLTGVTWTGPTPGAAVTSTDVMRDNALDPDPPAGPDPSMANPALDDPDFPAVPTRAEHSGLKG